MKRLGVVLMLVCVVALAGCNAVTGSTKQAVGNSSVLAQQVAFNAQSQAAPEGLKQYLVENAKQWCIAEDLLTNRHPRTMVLTPTGWLTNPTPAPTSATGGAQ
jgi:type II secretory pathway pseudopilin PulG